MRSRKLTLSALAAAMLQVGMVSAPASAGEVDASANSNVVWQAGVDGVVIEWSPTGDIDRIYSNYTHPVQFADFQGIRKAKIIAEEKAKAAIIRFMEQHSTSTRLVSEVESDVQTAVAREGNEGLSVSSETRRHMTETLTEVTTSFSEGTLKGVIVLEEGYDKDARAAWVKVGISRKTIKSATALRDALDGETASSVPQPGKTQASDRRSDPESHVRKTEQEDW